MSVREQELTGIRLETKKHHSSKLREELNSLQKEIDEIRIMHVSLTHKLASFRNEVCLTMQKSFQFIELLQDTHDLYDEVTRTTAIKNTKCDSELETKSSGERKYKIQTLQGDTESSDNDDGDIRELHADAWCAKEQRNRQMKVKRWKRTCDSSNVTSICSL